MPREFDINITLSDAALLGSAASPGQGSANRSAASAQSDEFDLELKYLDFSGALPGGSLAIDPAYEAAVGSGFFGITCSNTCAVGVGGGNTCAVTCSNTCAVGVGGGNTCAVTCTHTCQVLATCGNTCQVIATCSHTCAVVVGGGNTCSVTCAQGCAITNPPGCTSLPCAITPTLITALLGCGPGNKGGGNPPGNPPATP